MNRRKIHEGKFAFPVGWAAFLASLFLLTAVGCGGGGGSSSSESQDYSLKSQGYSLSGTVVPAEHMVSDSDVNDPFAAYESNDELYLAQELLPPVRVSGYVNLAGEGPAGRSHSQGDPDDCFIASLDGGTTVSLYMAEDPDSADLSLYLYDDDQYLVDASLTPTDAVESIIVPEDGIYYIRVEATESASVYALSVGDADALATRYSLRLSDDFVPGEVLVRLEEQEGVSAVSPLSKKGGVSSLGLYTKAGTTGRDRLLKRAETLDTPVFFKRLGIQTGLSRSLSHGNLNAAASEKIETLWMIRALKELPGVRYAEPNYIRRSLATIPNDEYYDLQWHYPLINLPEAWDITTGDSDVVVAVVDTGVLSGHPDLDGQMVAGYDFVDDDADPADEDEYFHGTHVTGTIAAESNNGQGVAGVAWNARIMPLRVLDENGEGSNWDILQAVQYAAGLSNASGMFPSTTADIINLSLGGESSSPIELEVYNEVREQGVIVIAAAGSNGTNTNMYPAAYEGVVAVGAVTSDGQHAAYSNFGVAVDVAAPGGGRNSSGEWSGVYSTFGEGGAGSGVSYSYGSLSGTSMAAPHVSGVAALMKSLYPGLTPQEFDALLQGGHLTRDGSPDWNLYLGYGLIDAFRAVQVAKAAGDSGELRPILYARPGRLDFSVLGSLLYLTVEHVGGGSLSVTDVFSDASWLSVSDVSVDAFGLGKYAVEVSRDGLSGGSYFSSITFETNEDPILVWVRMEVGEVSAALDGGFHYTLLVDPDTGEAVEIVSSGGEDGLYPYEFTNLSYGDTFLIIAGTDPDNDGFICGDGEACGSYPMTDDPIKVEVFGSKSGLDFYSDIQSELSLFSAESARSGKMALPVQLYDSKGFFK